MAQENPSDTNNVVDSVISRVLGEVMKRAREALGLSQSDVCARMPSKLHPKSLASYEQGVRHCTVVRFCEIARAIGTPAVDMLARTLMHAEIDMRTVVVCVDLQAVMADTDSELPDYTKLRRWARTRLDLYPENVATLDAAAIREMAILMNTPLISLVDQLAAYSISHGHAGHTTSSPDASGNGSTPKES